jgi:MFS family permease
VNNLNDGLAWAIFPLYFASHGLELDRITILAAVYPLTWGSLQAFTGWWSDRAGRRPLIIGGMGVQGGAIGLVGLSGSFAPWLGGVGLLGLGTALVYPTLLAAMSDAVPVIDRATVLGVYRFWRDAGAMVGALAGGAIADLSSFRVAIQAVAVLTVLSGVAVHLSTRTRANQRLEAFQ